MWIIILLYPQDDSIRIYIIATYAVHARSLLCEVASQTKTTHTYTCSLILIHIAPTGIPSWPLLSPSPVSYLWVVWPELVASWGPKLLHCTGERECAKQIFCLCPIWPPSGWQLDHRHRHCESLSLLACTSYCTYYILCEHWMHDQLSETL